MVALLPALALVWGLVGAGPTAFAGAGPDHVSAGKDPATSRSVVPELRTWAAEHFISVSPVSRSPYDNYLGQVEGWVTNESASAIFREIFRRSGNRNYLKLAIQSKARAVDCGPTISRCHALVDAVANDTCPERLVRTGWRGRPVSRKPWCEAVHLGLSVDSDCEALTGEPKELCRGFHSALREFSCDLGTTKASEYCQVLKFVLRPRRLTCSQNFSPWYLSSLSSLGFCNDAVEVGLKEYYEAFHRP